LVVIKTTFSPHWTYDLNLEFCTGFGLPAPLGISLASYIEQLGTRTNKRPAKQAEHPMDASM
jgi:hypothetical protein